MSTWKLTLTLILVLLFPSLTYAKLKDKQIGVDYLMTRLPL